MPFIRPSDRILFQGDSITDCGRAGTPWNLHGSNPLGDGYVAILAGMLQALRPDLCAQIINRGVSGNRTEELLARWRTDCIDLKPNVLSIKIGVNDVWRKMGEWDGQKHIPLPEYQAHLENLCAQALQAGVRQLVLLSPTTIAHDNHDPINDLLGEYAECCRTLAAKLGGIHVDARTPLLRARAAQPAIPWTPDGCHPSIAGHGLIAAAWWQAVVG